MVRKCGVASSSSERSKTRWQLIGDECYVHGTTDGEAYKMAEDKGLGALEAYTVLIESHSQPQRSSSRS